ncbi:MAG: hypothetical protein AAFN30_04385 [Actinomycetota bacterium]
MGDTDDHHAPADDGTATSSELDIGVEEPVDLGPEAETGSTPERPGGDRRSVLGRRIAGLLALVLGAVGLLASIVVGALVLWAGVTASSTIDDLVAPLIDTVERAETRIDQADDAVDRDGIDADRMPELRARAEGLADVGLAARQLTDRISEHPVYGRLPADLAGLVTATDDVARRTERINELVSGIADGRALPARTASEVTEELNTLQQGVDGVADTIDNAAGSLKRWVRLASLLGVAVAAWSGWAQLSLARRGLRGLRGQTG